jgi:hypothetical protein
MGVGFKGLVWKRLAAAPSLRLRPMSAAALGQDMNALLASYTEGECTTIKDYLARHSPCPPLTWGLAKPAGAHISPGGATGKSR